MKKKSSLESSLRETEVTLAVLQERLATRESLCEEQKTAILRQQEELESLKALRATLERERELIRNELEMQLKKLSDQTLRTAQESLFHQFKAHWNTIAEQDRQDWNKKELLIKHLLQPVQKELEQLKSSQYSSQEAWITNCNRLTEQIKSQVHHCLALQQETKELRDVLKNPNLKGRWGELRLKRIVEICGLVPYCDFDEQEREKDGKKRPDLTIKLPGNKSIVIDAKTPIQELLDISKMEEPQKKSKLKEHASQIKKHVQNVIKRDYWDIQLTPVFVIIFFPTDSLLGAAMESDPSLLEWAALQNVILSTPSTLIGLLTTISMCWSQHKNAENSELIRKKTMDILKILSLFLQNVSGLGKSIEGVVEHFNRLLKKAQTSLLPHFDDLKELTGQVEHKSLELKEISKEVCSYPSRPLM
ncbi:DNA recombination protein RmuC [Candidatus Similichlamydia laticola]|uniref:DNA recombination protein RmuC n=1 Tax=Candidatus Similichlamydia laticola TaxID=2170265 RepID=UPI0015F02D73|nr:DNA recombination protein RmuC [Candidatus Similichlamydia laticola]